MPDDELTLGEYMRRLRKAKGWQLSEVAEVTGMSYHHLSRIENDSSVPNADSVALISEALDGDLKRMLELADCLPKQILDRISARETTPRGTMTRSAGTGASGKGRRSDADVTALVRRFGISESDEHVVADAITKFLSLDRRRQKIVVDLMKQFGSTGEDGS